MARSPTSSHTSRATKCRRWARSRSRPRWRGPEEIPMFGYYLQLAIRNLRRNPGLTVLMIGAVALGIAVCVMTLTMYRAMSGNPIWWKNDVLYAVTMDFWDPQQPAWDKKPELPPEQLTYRDAMAVYRSDIPKHKVIMHKAVGILSVDGSQVAPERV